MNFEYAPEELAKSQEFAAFCATRLAEVPDTEPPVARHEAVRRNLATLGAAGLLGLEVAVADGGLGLGALAALPYHVALARASASTFAAAEASVATVGGLLARLGTPAQKQRFLPGLLAGSALAAFAVTEAAAGSDLSTTAATAAPSDGGWRLNGTKILVTNAPLADLALVLAQVDPAAPADTGLALFLVPCASPGVTVGPAEETLGLRGMTLGSLALVDCELPAEALLGPAGAGLGAVHEALLEGCLRYAAYSLGLIERCVDLALGHATTRTLGGKPIFRHQEVSFKLADMYALSDTALQLTRHAAWSRDQQGAKAATLIQAAKLFASEALARVAHLAVQVHGGQGFLAAHPVERLYRDARYAELAKVSSELLRVRIAADVFRGVGR
jgi:acyl-CoA dehydrogenase